MRFVSCWKAFDDVRNAIDREKKLKGWRRKKKLRLIAYFNPGWKDRARSGFASQGPSASLGMTGDERVRNFFSRWDKLRNLAATSWLRQANRHGPPS
jgi:hypothetical protein